MTPQSPAADRIVKRSVVIARHATSVSLEQAFWLELKRMAADRGLPLNGLVAEIDAAATVADGPGNLSSRLRLAVLRDLQRRARTD